MKTFLPAILALGFFFLTGCAGRSPAYGSHGSYGNESLMMRQAGSPPPPLEPLPNLFESDKAVLGDEAVRKILDYKFKAPEPVRIAIHKIEGRGGGRKYYGYYYWRDEEYQELQQRYFDTVKGRLGASKSVTEVKQLPALLTPSNLTIPLLREAAVRLQADLLVVYSINSEIFEKVRVFVPNTIKAYATCELIVFDVRTGIVPFSSIVTKKVETAKGEGDASENETRKRAENEAVIASLDELSAEAAKFLAR